MTAVASFFGIRGRSAARKIARRGNERRQGLPCWDRSEPRQWRGRSLGGKRKSAGASLVGIDPSHVSGEEDRREGKRKTAAYGCRLSCPSWDRTRTLLIQSQACCQLHQGAEACKIAAYAWVEKVVPERLSETFRVLMRTAEPQAPQKADGPVDWSSASSSLS